MTPEEKSKRFVKLGWEILRLKFHYYYRNETLVPDAEYDKLEREYDALAKELGLEPTASDMVGFDEKRPACQLVMRRERESRLEGHQVCPCGCGDSTPVTASPETGVDTLIA